MERLAAFLSRLHLHDDRGKLSSELRVNEFHLFAHAQHGLIQRKAGSQHDAQQIDGVRKRFLQLAAIALHQAMQHLRWNQPTQYQRGKQTSELRGERIAPLKIEHQAESREQKEQVAENVPGQRLLAANSRLLQLALRTSKPVFTAGKQADEV